MGWNSANTAPCGSASTAMRPTLCLVPAERLPTVLLSRQLHCNLKSVSKPTHAGGLFSRGCSTDGMPPMDTFPVLDVYIAGGWIVTYRLSPSNRTDRNKGLGRRRIGVHRSAQPNGPSTLPLSVPRTQKPLPLGSCTVAIPPASKMSKAGQSDWPPSFPTRLGRLVGALNANYRAQCGGIRLSRWSLRIV
jgi:hypothetical protein